MPPHDLSPALSPLLSDIQNRLDRGERLLIVLDGRCAAGKTSLARSLSQRYGWPTVHIDHFFLRPQQRTPQRYETPGENVDHERFLEQVLLPLRRGETALYRPFDCHTQQLSSPLRVEPRAVTVIEGSYSCHSALWPHYDLRVFLTVDSVEQLRRVAAREGEAQAKVFQERWIPLEEAYFAAFDLEKRCDYLLTL